MSERPPHREIADELTVLRAQLGEPAAHRELFRRYRARLLYFLRGISGRTEDADDALQDVWITVIERIHTLENPAAFRPWLYRVARNRAISKLRADRREVPLEDAPEIAAIPSEDSPAEDADAFAEYDAAALDRALDRLSAPHREVLALRFLEEMTYEQIASVVEVSVGTVRSRLHYAKRRARALLESEPEAEPGTYDTGDPHARHNADTR